MPKAKKKCIIERCQSSVQAKNLCNVHYQRTPATKARKRTYDVMRSGTTKRKAQNRQSSAKYIRHKGVYRLFQLWAKRKGYDLQITAEQYQEIRALPCELCNKSLPPTGFGVDIKDKKIPFTVENAVTICGICRLIKPVAEFHWFAHSKRTLRRQWKRTPMAVLALQRARSAAGWVCAKCLETFDKRSINIDHITPVVSVYAPPSEDLNEFARRLFCSADGLQVLCLTCHKQKTKIENKERREYAKRRKNTVRPF